ncbi:histidine kinase [Sphingomonas oleivorans]|uniref:histidine kinase n=1 Tax=Sphingomonas oleivorans TaxID=1735121 RepID=A0A2T5FVM0_9SPHN|nr:ATP-binding sensor histidine kinase [Sphingomonas oleivorans]PTQ09825.1 histidine kinase [Sphingomonas oleivorans]
MIDVTGYTLSLLREGEMFCYRGSSGDHDPILLIEPSCEDAGVQTPKVLQHEFALREYLDAAWAARPLALTRRASRAALVLADPGGELLERLLHNEADQAPIPMDVTTFLPIARSIAQAVREMHARGIVHRNLSPAHILVKPASNEAWLTGFGVASVVPSERTSLEPVEIIVGTPQYMAPEQTGRMNRPIDNRCDLYAIGIIFYQMLTGTLPFSASDAAGWIYSHIARAPIPPHERLDSIDEQLSLIIMKLLSKTPEDRYQSAKGLVADLTKCLDGWTQTGKLGRFELGLLDIPQTLRLPDRLYGRAHEQARLVSAFDQIGSGLEFVLISGPSGTGKSALADVLKKAGDPAGQLFVAGKFEQYKQDRPYVIIADAFEQLVRPILGQDGAKLQFWRQKIQDALGQNGGLIVDLVPELALLVGDQPAIPPLPAEDARRRLHATMRRFLGAFTMGGQPLILVFDDLQWADPATLAFVRELILEGQDHLLLIGTYRDDEVGLEHPLSSLLDILDSARASVERIHLSPLTGADVEQLIRETLGSEHNSNQIHPLSDFIERQTGGNPLFIHQFLSQLADEGLIWFDTRIQSWFWSLERIGQRIYTDDVVDLLVSKLTRLPSTTLDMLKSCACVGRQARAGILSALGDKPVDTVDGALSPAVDAGLLNRRDDVYTFPHDRIQEAAYSLISEADRSVTHAAIGRCLARHLTADSPADLVFEVVDQSNRGIGAVSEQAEIRRIAEYNLVAGRKAKGATAYASAFTFFHVGASLLDQAWAASDDALQFALMLGQAECEFLTGAIVEAEAHLLELCNAASSSIEKAEATTILLRLYTATDRNDRAVAIGLEYLREAGIMWSAAPSDDEIAHQYQAMWDELGTRSIEDLNSLPEMVDPAWLATMDVLSELIAPASYVDQNLLGQVLICIARLSMKWGNSPGASFAYVCFNMVAGARFGDYPTGYRFGKLALALSEKHGLDRLGWRVAMCFACMVNPWINHIATERALLEQATDWADEAGDVIFAAYGREMITANMLVSGESLEIVEARTVSVLERARKAGIFLVVGFAEAKLGLVRMLRGNSVQFGVFDNDELDAAALERRLEDPGLAMAKFRYWIRKLQAGVFAQDGAAALDAAAVAKGLLWTSPAFFESAEYHFYAALARSTIVAAGSWHENARIVEDIKEHLSNIELWASQCPTNFENRRALAAAELARIEGRTVDAMRLYDDAVRAAHRHGFIQNAALSNEMAARFYIGQGFETIAETYLRAAYDAYAAWGAIGKVRHLERQYPSILGKILPSPSSYSTVETPLASLDISTVINASQTLSREIDLTRLIEELLKMVLVHAGAERGKLLLVRDGHYVTAAEAEAEPASNLVHVTFDQRSAKTTDIPESLIQEVLDSRETIVLKDIGQAALAAQDQYLLEHRPYAAACLALVKQSELVGMLYIENRLAPAAFTAARMAVLEILASQAAISLENARLYSELTDENLERKRVMDALRLSEYSRSEGQRLSKSGDWRWNVETGELHWSDGVFRIHGIDPDGVRPDYSFLLNRVHPDDLESVKRSTFEVIQQCLPVEHDYRIILDDGSVKHLWATAAPKLTGSKVTEVIGFVMDVTEQRRAEAALRALQFEAARASRLTAIGQFAASIAHEVNQPLSAITTNAEAGLRWLGRAEADIGEARDAFDRILCGVKRAEDVVRGVRAIARKTGPDISEVSVKDLLDDVRSLVTSELQRGDASLDIFLPVEPPIVRADRVQLQIVIVNLVRNGIDAMRHVDDRPRMIRISVTIPDRGRIEFLVEDTGPGLDSAIADRVFEPMMTTKSDGMGMGLSICQSIIKAHGGQLCSVARDVPGAAFRFSVPRA